VGQGVESSLRAAQDLLALNMDLPSVMQAGRWRDTRMPIRKVLAGKRGNGEGGESTGTRMRNATMEKAHNHQMNFCAA